eukprot:scaffold1919_cov394-Prasinococcus_capsulatus_cf.AAC.4
MSSPKNITRLAGRFTPAPKVDVATRTRTRPVRKACSTTFRSSTDTPAWWNAQPSRTALHSSVLRFLAALIKLSSKQAFVPVWFGLHSAPGSSMCSVEQACRMSAQQRCAFIRLEQNTKQEPPCAMHSRRRVLTSKAIECVYSTTKDPLLTCAMSNTGHSIGKGQRGRCWACKVEILMELAPKIENLRKKGLETSTTVRVGKHMYLIYHNRANVSNPLLFNEAAQHRVGPLEGANKNSDFRARSPIQPTTNAVAAFHYFARPFQ